APAVNPHESAWFRKTLRTLYFKGIFIPHESTWFHLLPRHFMSNILGKRESTGRFSNAKARVNCHAHGLQLEFQ
ncbi:MAG: hypothetical protein LBR94_02520, partial [Desulfovibrio sp.]|nr:hypothetical protein [Desulfovibrio sp.]